MSDSPGVPIVPPLVFVLPPHHAGLSVTLQAPSHVNLNCTMQAPRRPGPKDWSPRGEDGIVREANWWR